jgi:phage gp36-like protein
MRWLIVCLAGMLLLRPVRLPAQSQEAQQLLLNVEKLTQLRQILDNLYKGYEILRTGYTAIKDISEGNFSIHKVFLDKLLEVSPVVKNYRRVADIINGQIRILKEGKAAFNRFRQNENFTESEIGYLGRVYNRLYSSSLKNLDELLIVVTAGQVRMSDDERLAAIDRIYNEVDRQLSFLRKFNAGNTILGLQRAGEQREVDVMRKVHGIK